MQKFWILAVVFAVVFYAYFRNPSDLTDEDVLEELEEGWEILQASNVCRSLLKKHLSRDVFDQLKHRRTSTGATLLDVIQSGIVNLDSGVGVYAPDAESYTTFDLLFEPIIVEYHGTTTPQPAHDFGDLDFFTSLDSDYVLSTRIRCARNLQGYTFSPLLTEKEYQEMEYKIVGALTSFDGDLNGTYYPLTGMEESTRTKLVSDHFLFKQGDRFLQAANACRFWPTGRGIFHNKDKTFLVWVNEEDHLRIISMQSGGDLKQVYRRLVQAVQGIESRLPFSHDAELGFLTFCPTNLGTTIRASVHIRLPHLAKHLEQLETVAAEYNLQVRGIHGEHSESEGGVFDISNKRRMGLTEYEAVKDMQDGVQKIIELEKKISEDTSMNWF